MQIAKNVQPPTGLTRLLFRVPICVYRAGLGRIFGQRLLLLRHVGRISGKQRQAILEVAEHDPADGSFIVASGWGPTAAWYRNVVHMPEVTIQVGRRVIPVTAVKLTEEEGADTFARYGMRHRRAAKYLLPRMLGFSVDGSEADFRAVGRQVPFIRFVPRPWVAGAAIRGASRVQRGTDPEPSGGQVLRWLARMVRNPLATYLGLQRAYGGELQSPRSSGCAEKIVSARQHADTFDRNRPRKKSRRMVAVTAALLLIGISDPAAALATKHTTAGSTVSADADEVVVAHPLPTIPGNPAYSDARTAIGTMATPTAAPEAHTSQATLTGCVPGLNC